jgi:hypothetical protein
MPMGQQQANASDRREPQHVVFLSGSRSVVDVEINRDTTSRAPHTGRRSSTARVTDLSKGTGVTAA